MFWEGRQCHGKPLISDLTDVGWADSNRSYLPRTGLVSPREVELREVVNALMYVATTALNGGRILTFRQQTVPACFRHQTRVECRTNQSNPAIQASPTWGRTQRNNRIWWWIVNRWEMKPKGTEHVWLWWHCRGSKKRKRHVSGRIGPDVVLFCQIRPMLLMSKLHQLMLDSCIGR